MNILDLALRRFVTLPIAFIALAACNLCPAQAAPSPDRVIFYAEPNFKGESLIVEAGATVENLDRLKRENLRSWLFAISSVRVEGAARALVYSEPAFQGYQLEIAASNPDLFVDRLGQQPGATWDRAIASIRVTVPRSTIVVAPPVYNEPPPPPVYVVPVPVPPPVVREVRPMYDRRTAEAMVQHAYRDVLMRPADPEGLQTYRERLMREGWTERQIVEALQRSQEARSIKPEEAITRAFRDVLARDPDPNGMNHYRQLWRDGWTQGQIREDLGKSKEGRDVVIKLTITKAYRELLGREPDPIGYASYEKLMREKGWTDRQLREALMSGDEYRQRRGKK